MIEDALKMDKINTSIKIRRILIDNQPKDFFPRDKFAHLFEERAILLAEKDDIVILRNALPEEYLKFIKDSFMVQILFLDDLDYECELADVVLHNLKLIKKLVRESHITYKNVIQAYIPDKKIDLVATELGISVSGEKFFWDNYKKSDTQRICFELEFNIIPSVLITELTDFNSKAVHDFINTHKKILLKPDIGVGGQSVSMHCAGEAFILPFVPAIIQEFLVAQFEGSIQFIKRSDRWKIYLCETFQNSNKFYGFKYPLPHIGFKKLELSAQKFLDYFVGKYGCDIPSFGIDFIVNNNKVYFHDINPRSTGVTYVFSLINHLYGNESLDKIEFIYLQSECSCSYTYSELRKRIDECGLTHISNSSIEGYALLYPSLLEANFVNILIVSSEGKIDEYRKMISHVIGLRV